MTILNGEWVRLLTRSPGRRDSDKNLEFIPKYNSVNQALIHEMGNSNRGPGKATENIFLGFLKNSAKLVDLIKAVLD